MHLENWFKIEFICTYKLNISPLELDRMEFYRIEYILKNFEEHLDEENKQYKSKQREYEKQYQQYKPSTKDFKPPTGVNYGGFKVPKMDVPKIKAPKFNV